MVTVRVLIARASRQTLDSATVGEKARELYADPRGERPLATLHTLRQQR